MASDSATSEQEFSFLKDWIMPEGKSLGDCTGSELKKWAAEAHRQAQEALGNGEALAAVADGSRDPQTLMKAYNVVEVERHKARGKKNVTLLDFAAHGRQGPDVLEEIAAIKPADRVAVAVVLDGANAGPHAERVWAEVIAAEDNGWRCRLGKRFRFVKAECRPGQIIRVRPCHVAAVMAVGAPS